MNFKDLKEETIGLANQTFSETYEKIFRTYWHDNRFIANSSQVYRNSDPKNGEYQICIPTKMNPETCMQYSNIIVKVVPEITQEQARGLADALHKKSVKPAGTLDSELIVIVALQRHGWTRGFRHIQTEKGYFTAIFVANDKHTVSTNELWRKLMQKVIIPFYEKRISNFLECFNLTQDEHRNRLAVTQLYYKGASIIERLDMACGLFVKSMSHFINWLHCKLNWFTEQFRAIQATRHAEKKALEHCKPLRLGLRIQSKRRLINDLLISLHAEEKLYENLTKGRIEAERDLTPEEKIEEYYLQRLPIKVTCHG